MAALGRTHNITSSQDREDRPEPARHIANAGIN